MSEKRYVVGHQNPDTDAICSAIVFAQFLQDMELEAEPIALGDPNTETRFVLASAGVEMPEVATELPAGSKIVLVDHNEAGQSIPNRERYDLIGVVDHHKIADFATSGPVMVRMDPVGSTCSVMAKMFDSEGYQPSPIIAELMIASIISDTLYFRSATTTELDKTIVKNLNKVAEIDDLEEYSNQMFDAKSDLSELTAAEIVIMDYKTFEMDEYDVGIGVTETTNPSFALDRKDEILQAMQEVKQEQGLDYLLFCVIDIFNEENSAFVLGDAERKLLELVFAAETTDNLADLGARLSRKKQLVPPLADYFSSL